MALTAQLALQVANAYRNSPELSAAFCAGLLAGFQGVLTGTITSAAQLPTTTFNASASLVAGAGGWTVYDADAHPAYPGSAVVLRKPCATAPSMYKYLLLWFKESIAVNGSYTYYHINGVIGFMGGWDSVAKAPTTLMTLSTGGTIDVGVPLSTSNLAVSAHTALVAAGNSGSSYFCGDGFAGNNYPVSTPYYLLVDTPDTTTYWPHGNGGTLAASAFPMGLQFEYVPSHGWVNTAAGCLPVVSGHVCGGSYITLYGTHTRDTGGKVVQPATTRVTSALAHGGATGLGAAAFLIDKYLCLGSGATAIPLAPLEVSMTCTVNSNIAYVGRASSLFATHCGLALGDGFSDGANSYIVIPTGAFTAIAAGSVSAAHSPRARLALRVS